MTVLSVRSCSEIHIKGAFVMDLKHQLLKEYFGHSEFRSGQETIIDELISGRDALCIMPTGAGKSLCYQIPAMMLDGITIVVSPLISLMNDQVISLTQSGVRAAYLNSSLTQLQYVRVLENIKAGTYKMIYVAPERLTTDAFLSICRRIKISLVAVDEAHCVSQWGQDFRPSYLKILDFIGALECRPTVGAFTATATDRVKEDIIDILQLNDPFTITTGFDRPNLFFSVIKPQAKSEKLIDLISRRSDKSGIIYCATRKTVEEVCVLLCENGYSATRYHAGLSEQERSQNQEDFVYDRKTVMVATNAFGMGIDKSNVSYVIHYNMPKNIESYYQEAGRAGRDGEEAECILMYSPVDVHTNQFLIEHSEPNQELDEEQQIAVRKTEHERLRQMTFYCTTNDCLRSFILKYFGEKPRSCCGKCSNCLTQYETIDATVQAQKILSCIIRAGQRYGRKMIIDVLRGSKNEKLLRLGLDKLTTYGIMKDTSEKSIRDIMLCLEEEGYILTTTGDYPIVKVTASGGDILKGQTEFVIKIPKEKQPMPEKVSRRSDRDKPNADSELFEKLRSLRRELADEANVPAYIIFSNASLIDMCRILPTNDNEFLEVSGVGKQKLQKYGDRFISVIREHLDNKGK